MNQANMIKSKSTANIAGMESVARLTYLLIEGTMKLITSGKSKAQTGIKTTGVLLNSLIDTAGAILAKEYRAFMSHQHE